MKELKNPEKLMAANMVARLQGLKGEGELSDVPHASLQAIAHEYFSDGSTTTAARLGFDAEEVRELGELMRRSFLQKMNDNFRNLVRSMEKSTATRVANFETFVDKALDEIHPHLSKTEKENRLRAYMNAYTEDHGTPLFSAKGSMRDLNFPGADMLADEDLKREYKDLSRIYAWGSESSRNRDARFTHHAKGELRARFPAADDKTIDKKYTEKEYGESIVRSFAIMDIDRDRFREFSLKRIRDNARIPVKDRLFMLESMMTQYDHEHYFGPFTQGTHPLRDAHELYKKLKTEFDRNLFPAEEERAR